MEMQQHQTPISAARMKRRCKSRGAPSGGSSASTRRLALTSLLACCGLCGAFLPPPVVVNTSRQPASASSTRPSPSARVGRRSRQLSRSGGLATANNVVRMQGSTDDELQLAVRSLAAQVEDLTAVVRQLTGEQPSSSGAVATTSATQNINGAAVGKGGPAVPGVPAGKAASKGGSGELVSTSAAQQRIDQWLEESGGGQAAPAAIPIAAAASSAVAPAEAKAVAAPSVPETTAPPVEGTPADEGSGYKVKIDWEGSTHEITCDAETTVLDAAMEAGFELPHSCMSGSCLTCPAKLISGSVDQSEGVLEDEQTDEGYMLTCVSYPQSDVHFTVVDEDDLP